MTNTLLINIQKKIASIGYPICLVMGNFSGAIGLFVFFQKPLRRNPCELFIIVYMMINICYINFTILLSVLFNITPSIQSTIFCRIQYYINFVLPVIPSYLLVMASADRSFFSSRNVQIRLRSTQPFATLIIGIICIFWIILHVHDFFTVDLELINNIQFICTFRQDISTTFVAYYNLICIGLIPPLLMTEHDSRNNRQLILLLIVQVTYYLRLLLSASSYLIYKRITNTNMKTSDQLIIEQFIQSVTYFCQFIQVSISPLLNLNERLIEF